jgi:hypothetical protein
MEAIRGYQLRPAFNPVVALGIAVAAMGWVCLILQARDVFRMHSTEKWLCGVMGGLGIALAVSGCCARVRVLAAQPIEQQPQAEPVRPDTARRLLVEAIRDSLAAISPEQARPIAEAYRAQYPNEAAARIALLQDATGLQDQPEHLQLESVMEVWRGMQRLHMGEDKSTEAFTREVEVLQKVGNHDEWQHSDIQGPLTVSLFHNLWGLCHYWIMWTASGPGDAGMAALVARWGQAAFDCEPELGPVEDWLDSLVGQGYWMWTDQAAYRLRFFQCLASLLHVPGTPQSFYQGVQSAALGILESWGDDERDDSSPVPIRNRPIVEQSGLLNLLAEQISTEALLAARLATVQQLYAELPNH